MRKISRITACILFYILTIPVFSQTTGTLSFSCATYAPVEDYGKSHVVVTWIQNKVDSTLFLQTIAKYGWENDHLTSWVDLTDENIVDAVTGNTLLSYDTISVEWDGTDYLHNVVPDGDYYFYIEMGWGKDHVVDHAVNRYSFTKGPSELHLTPAGNEHFFSINLDWEPTVSLIPSSAFANGVYLFPNPSKEEIKLNFNEDMEDVKIVIADLSGNILLNEKYKHIYRGEKSIGFLDIPAGMYLITITSNNKYFAYKILINE